MPQTLDRPRYASPKLDALRTEAHEARLTADWLQSLAAEAQRAAVMAARAVQREKARMRAAGA